MVLIGHVGFSENGGFVERSCGNRSCSANGLYGSQSSHDNRESYEDQRFCGSEGSYSGQRS